MYVLVHIRSKGAVWCRLSNRYFLADRSKAVLVLWIFVICLCHTAMSVSCILDDTYWEKADVLAFLYVVFFLCSCHFPIGCPESGVVHDCIVPDLWLLSCSFLGKLFERKSNPVRDGLMFVKGH